MHPHIDFLRSQKLLTLACHNENEVWAASVYFGADEGGTIFFISPKDTKHSAMILENPAIAFSCAWFDAGNHKNRKAVQGLGVCRVAQTEDEIARGVALHNKNFPEFANKISVDWIRANEWGSYVWIVQPTFMKYWDDELYGADENAEFTF